MLPQTRKVYNQYLAQIRQLNSIESTAEKFSVDPTIQQKLEARIQDSSAFLKRVNILGVNEMEGEKVGINVNGPIASRTDTTGTTPRAPRDVKSLDKQKYRCEQTNYDTLIRYNTLDAWAKFPDFQQRLRNSIVTKMGLDRLMIGFNGTSAAATTNLVNNPLLEDVNIGWLQQIRDNASERHMFEVVDSSGEINVGDGGDYQNLDALVFDVVNSLIEPWYRDHPDIKAIIGRQLAVDYTIPQISEYDAPTEREALARLIAKSKIGGVPAVQVPYMLPSAILITIPANLSIYYQNSARRRMIKDEPEWDRIANYESSNDGYVVEDYGAAALIENVQFV